jgi:hypothetical protein
MTLLLFLALAMPHGALINGDPWLLLEKKVVHNNRYLLAWTDCAIRVIEVRTDQTDQDKADALVHEVMHALTCDAFGNTNNDLWNNETEYHDGIYWGAPRLLRFLQDNPQVVKYLMDAGKGK